jgi:hypothetical protein
MIAGCDGGKTLYIGSDSRAAACNAPPAAPPAALGLDPFYAQYLDGGGIPVLSSSAVSPAALAQSCLTVEHMLKQRPDVAQAMTALAMRVAVIARGEVTTDIPEYRDLNTAFPGTNWDALRGVGATVARPVSSVGEENVLCDAADPYRGENILVQTFSSAVLLGVERVDASFEPRLTTAFDAATAAGLWQSTFATKNEIEYYAMGVQDWFDAGGEANPPDGVHNSINTRDELQGYDPTLAALVGETMPHDAWRPRCP